MGLDQLEPFFFFFGVIPLSSLCTFPPFFSTEVRGGLGRSLRGAVESGRAAEPQQSRRGHRATLIVWAIALGSGCMAPPASRGQHASHALAEPRAATPAAGAAASMLPASQRESGSR